MSFDIQIDREEDGRYIAEAANRPGVMAYGATEEEARKAVGRLLCEVLVADPGFQALPTEERRIASIMARTEPDGPADA